MNVPFSPPDIGELEIQYVTEVLRSGWITTGPKAKELEQRIQDYMQMERVVCLNSATAAMELSLRLLGIGPGDEVITCAYTYTASASVIDHVGAKIVMVDCLPNSCYIDPEKVRAAITENTKAIIPIDIAGIPADYQALIAIIESEKSKFHPNSELQRELGRIAIVADCAHSFGATYHGAPVATQADFACFSFHAVKNFTTAEGGCVAFNHIGNISSDELYRRFQLYSLHGQTKDALAKTTLGAWEYDIVLPAYKCNMTDIMAAIGLAQLERYPGLLKRREELVLRYQQALGDIAETLPHFSDDYQSCYHMFFVRVPNLTLEQRNEVIVRMAEKGVSANVHYKPLPLLSAYRNLGFDIADYPNAYQLYQNEITLPLFSTMTDEQCLYVIETFKNSLSEVLA